MVHLSDSYQGFHFRYFSPNKDGLPVPTKPTKQALEAEDIILVRVAEMLKNRPDIMRRLLRLENGLEVRIYQGRGFKDYELELYFYGRTTVSGDDVILELAADEVLDGGKDSHEVLDVVVHEMIHIIDYLDDTDGIMPGWSKTQKEQFYTARDEERERIRDGTSPLVGYALTNDVEFLAVLGEVFFIRPDALQETNLTLYDLMKAFFKQDPGDTKKAKKRNPKEPSAKKAAPKTKKSKPTKG